MKRFATILFSLALPALLASAADSNNTSGPREIFNFNPGWKFILGNPTGAQEPGFDDSNWQSITLPHSFSTPYWGEPTFYTGYGWYRKQFEVKPNWSGKRIFLQFDAAFQDAVVYVNGTLIGEHKGGFTGFSMDVTSAVQRGTNLVAVQLNNLWNAQICPLTGDHEFSGGIYRDVSLVITDPLHVAWYGTQVTTPQISATASNVNVQTEVVNNDGSADLCTVVSTVLDPDNQEVVSVRTQESVPTNSTVVFNQTTVPIVNPRLWTPETPFLYHVETAVYKQNKLVDNFESPLGFRWMEWTPEQGFFLNGQHYYFHGANVHQDHAGWCDAVSDTGIGRDVQLVKQAGFDFIRGSHYSHSPKFTDACDRLGVMFWSENCFWGVGNSGTDGSWTTSNGYPDNAADIPGFEQNVLDTLTDMIRIHRNHPSVIIWSMCNEIFNATNQAGMKSLLTQEVNLTHQLDPSRKAAIGGAQRDGVDTLGDVAGYNGDGAYLFFDPGIPNVVSEYGSVKEQRPGSYDPNWGYLTYFSNPPIEYAWRSGQAIWCGFDYGTIFATPGQGVSSYGSMGIIDYFRLPKENWYWYRKAYANVPPPTWPQPGTPTQLSLTSSAYQIQAGGTDDCQLVVTVLDNNGTPISNSVPVTLTILSGPAIFPTGSTITFDPATPDIPIRNGQAAIEMHVSGSGQVTVQAASTGLQAATITIKVSAPVNTE
jgi:hypothetical protein